MSKDTRKTIRLSAELMEFIESQPGDHFTQKLESLLLRQKLEIPLREKEIERLEEKINEANRTLNEFKEIQSDMYALAERLKKHADKILAN